jgi:hypothetical protein
MLSFNISGGDGGRGLGTKVLYRASPERLLRQAPALFFMQNASDAETE